MDALSWVLEKAAGLVSSPLFSQIRNLCNKRLSECFVSFDKIRGKSKNRTCKTQRKEEEAAAAQLAEEFCGFILTVVLTSSMLFGMTTLLGILHFLSLFC